MIHDSEEVCRTVVRSISVEIVVYFVSRVSNVSRSKAWSYRCTLIVSGNVCGGSCGCICDLGPQLAIINSRRETPYGLVLSDIRVEGCSGAWGGQRCCTIFCRIGTDINGGRV
jgi:hypothetical protein